MRVAAVQMVSSTRLDDNLAAMRRQVGDAAAAGARLVALPEYFCLLGRQDTDKLAIAEAPGHGPIQAALAETAARHGVWLIGGTLPMRIDGQADKVRNSCLVFDPQGGQSARYDKMHLFAFDNGSERYDEARVLQAGSEPAGAWAAGLHVGLSVCYDLRFPEFYRALAAACGAPPDLICVPAAFTWTTGRAHWELLLRARAIENQCYVLAPAQGGVHENGRRTWGHSMVVDPWGEVLAQRAEGEGLVLADIEPARLQEVRRQLPALQHRRL
ncbi:MAG TPA: carbon-nitrogen hydrolase family protein [Rubrivivax sp.]|jgi:predicted amidohydrolase|nr:carbon-nitrogen hydrolase family protein [Rubrivivax sp.]